MYELASKLPGPKGLPFIGIGHKFLNANFKNIFDILTTISDGYGEEIVKIWIGPELLVFADVPQIIQIVMNSPKCLDKSSFYTQFKLELGLGMLGGNVWKKHRKAINPAFGLNILQQHLVPIFDEKSKILVKNIKNMVGKGQFDIYQHLGACSLETLLKGILDIDRDVQNNRENDVYLQNIDEFVYSKLLNVPIK